jgi:hypothetical protein
MKSFFRIVWSSSLVAFFVGAGAHAENATDPGFLGGYCSVTTVAGQWDVEWGEGDSRMRCVLAEQRLGSTGSPIEKKSEGDYDMYDVNTVTVTCQDAAHTFVVEDLGSQAIGNAVRKAKNSGGTHCLLVASPVMPASKH